jgi:hypothetical protein
MLATPRRNLEPFPARGLILRDAPKGRFSEAASKCRQIAALCKARHVRAKARSASSRWMSRASYSGGGKKGVDGRDKPGRDEKGITSTGYLVRLRASPRQPCFLDYNNFHDAIVPIMAGIA